MKLRNLFFILVCFYVFLVISCGHETREPVKEEVRKVDSTPYYDSLFREARYCIDTFFQKRFDQELFNGNVLFAYKGHIILKKSYGFCQPGDSSELCLQHKFQLASVTKTFTSTAILQLWEKGKLRLDDSVQYYIDSFPYKGITVGMLLCHRGGLSKYEYYSDDYWMDKTIPITNADVVGIMKKYQPKPYHKPDGTFEYSNTGYILLALIIEKASGMKYGDYLKKYIFDPAGMKETFVYVKGDPVNDSMQLNGYNGKENLIEDTYLNGVYGDKGVYSTAGDLLKYDRALRKNILLKKKTQKMAYTPTSKEREEKGKDNYGLGWRLKNSHHGFQIVYHTGWWKGFRTNFIRNMSKDFTIITLDNIKRGPFISVEQLLDLVTSVREHGRKKK